MPSSLEDEVNHLQQAMKVLWNDPNRALRICNESASLYPNGPLAQERDFLTIQVLRRLGRMDEAKARAASFDLSHPDSIYHSRVHELADQPNLAY